MHGAFRKPLWSMALGPEAWRLPFGPDFAVDDHPGLPTFVGGITVTAYVDRRDAGTDTEMDRVYAAITAASRARR